MSGLSHAVSEMCAMYVQTIDWHVYTVRTNTLVNAYCTISSTPSTTMTNQ